MFVVVVVVVVGRRSCTCDLSQDYGLLVPACPNAGFDVVRLTSTTSCNGFSYTTKVATCVSRLCSGTQFSMYDLEAVMDQACASAQMGGCGCTAEVVVLAAAGGGGSNPSTPTRAPSPSASPAPAVPITVSVRGSFGVVNVQVVLFTPAVREAFLRALAQIAGLLPSGISLTWTEGRRRRLQTGTVYIGAEYTILVNSTTDYAKVMGNASVIAEALNAGIAANQVVAIVQGDSAVPSSTRTSLASASLVQPALPSLVVNEETVVTLSPVPSPPPALTPGVCSPSCRSPFTCARLNSQNVCVCPNTHVAAHGECVLRDRPFCVLWRSDADRTFGIVDSGSTAERSMGPNVDANVTAFSCPLAPLPSVNGVAFATQCVICSTNIGCMYRDAGAPPPALLTSCPYPSVYVGANVTESSLATATLSLTLNAYTYTTDEPDSLMTTPRESGTAARAAGAVIGGFVAALVLVVVALVGAWRYRVYELGKHQQKTSVVDTTRSEKPTMEGGWHVSEVHKELFRVENPVVAANGAPTPSGTGV